MDADSLSNLLAYSAQLAFVVAIGCALPGLLRLDTPVVRFFYWRMLVLLCLALPFVQSKQAVEMSAPGRAAVGASLSAVAPPDAAAVARAAGADVNWPLVVGVVLAGGILLRLAWMAAGLFYLRRLRTAGSPAPVDADTLDLQRLLGTSADVRYVPGLTQPVTFGVLRPVVLLPDGLRDHPQDIRRAVMAHELVHVQRRDWLWIVGEEIVRAGLWFHPAMWWLMSRVQLAREEVVDELAVTITGKRRTYVEALLAFADTTPLAPAPAFAMRRHLFRRMVLISREAVMSSNRIVASCAVMTMVVAAGSWYAVAAFPMQQPTPVVVTSGQPGPLEASAKPITPENPIPRRLVSIAPDYPSDVASSGARGTVTMRVTLDAMGRVAEVRPTNVNVKSETPQFNVSFSNAQGGDRDRLLAMQLGPTDAATAVAILDALTKAATDGVRRWSYEPPANAPISFVVGFNFAPGTETASSQLASAPTERTLMRGAGGGGSVVQWAADGAVRVGGNVKPPAKIRDVRPAYPAEAQAARVSGVVIIEARVEPDGTVGNAHVLRSIPLLDQAAIDAVMQWQFTPTLMNGQAVAVVMTVTVNFTLQ
jgi:TonB family protein